MKKDLQGSTQGSPMEFLTPFELWWLVRKGVKKVNSEGAWRMNISLFVFDKLCYCLTREEANHFLHFYSA